MLVQDVSDLALATVDLTRQLDDAHELAATQADEAHAVAVQIRAGALTIGGQ